MSLFNFRRAGPSSAVAGASAAQTESVDVIRRRAKHRLIGSAVLVLVGVLGFPLLFDTQPRPIAIDIPIEIPSKTAVKPLALPSRQPATASAPPAAATSTPAPVVAPPPLASAPASVPDKVAAASSLGEREEILGQKSVSAQVDPAQAAIKNEAKPTPRADVKVDAKVAVKPETKTGAKPAEPSIDGARARALLEGTAPVSTASGLDKPAPAKVDAAAPVEGRVIVQVGAYADAAKAREARSKLEKAGLKTYTQVAETSDGKRTRVRVGPFASRADAEKAASKIKTLDLPASILTL